jgi:hypothetical protein
MASYTTVLALALTQAPEKCLSLRSLYLFIEQHSQLLPFTARPQWRRSVRHALSRQHCFSRVDANGKAVDGGARRCLWTVDLSRLPQPTRTALNHYTDGMSLVDVLRRPNTTKTAVSRTTAAKRDTASAKSNSGRVASDEQAQASIQADAPGLTTVVATGTSRHATSAQQLPPASSGVAIHASSAPLFDGQTPQSGAAFPFLQVMLQQQQQIQEQWEQPTQQHVGLPQNEQGQHQEQQCATNNDGTIALLSSWASLAGLSSEEISSALATAATAADTGSQRLNEPERPEEQAQGCLQGEQQRLRHELERQQLRRHLGQCLEQYDVPHQQQQQPLQQQANQALQEGQEQSLARLYQSQMLSALHSFDRPGRAALESYPRVSNNDGWLNMAAAAADLAAGSRFALGASAFEQNGSLIGIAQPGTRDSGLADEIDDDLILEALDPDAYRLGPSTRYAMLLELVKSLNHTRASSMHQQGFVSTQTAGEIKPNHAGQAE